MEHFHKNPRKISERQSKELAKSLEDLGDLAGLIKDINTDEIIGGNQRFDYFEKHGYEIDIVYHYEKPKADGTVAEGFIICNDQRFAYREVDWTAEQCDRACIAANKMGGDWDFKLIEEHFTLEALELGGFTDFELMEFVPNLFEVEGEAEETKQDDETPEVDLDAVADSQPGKIYQLGPHRLLCGDARNSEQLKELMNGDLAEVWITDPPYNVAYKGGTDEALTIKNDSMSDGDFRKFLSDAYKAADSVMAPACIFYIWHADKESINFFCAASDAGWKVRQCLIWVKNSLVMGGSDYHFKHEPCLYGWKKGDAHSWSNDRKQTTVLNFDRPSRSTDHPTMKPVALFEYQISNHGKAGSIVLDTFGGSGTTLIASAKAKRVCRIVELSPNYCDVIRRRWTNWAHENGFEAGSGLL